MITRFPTLLLSLVLAVLSGTAAASDSGRVDLNPIAATLGTNPKVNINFGTAIMAGFAETLGESSPEVAALLRGITGLRLMVFEGIDSSGAEPQVLGIIQRLESGGWTPAITVEDESSRINILLLESGEFVHGLVLLLRDGSDTAVFANIHGQLDPVTIGRLIANGQAMKDLNFEQLMNQIQN